MARKPSDAPMTDGAVIPDAVYEITVNAPFQYRRIQFLPALDRVYRVKGSFLLEIKDKVNDFRRVG